MNRKIPAFYAICFILFTLFCVIMVSVFFRLNPSEPIVSVNTVYPTVVVDAGHGGEDGGAVSENGILEKDINLNIANNMSDLLRVFGLNVVQTRNSDISLSSEEASVHSRKVADLKKRLEIFNSSSDNTIISIHQNKFSQSKYLGTQVFYSPNSEKSAQLAECIKNSVKKLLQPENERECKKADGSIYLLKNAKNPAVIVECGFISNPDELKKLTATDYQKEMAMSVVSGFLDYTHKINLK